eukprot:gene9191-1277_t
MKVLLFLLICTLGLVHAAKNVVWSIYPQRSICEKNYLLQQTVIKPKECVPLTGSRKNEYIAAICSKSKIFIKRCEDSNCQKCENFNYDTKKCYLDTNRLVHQKFTCGEAKSLKSVDFTFKNFNSQRCTGKFSENIVRGHCIHINPNQSWKNYCEKRDGLIWVKVYNNGDCEGKPTEENSRPTKVCQPNWLGGLHVIFGNCTRK